MSYDTPSDYIIEQLNQYLNQYPQNIPFLLNGREHDNYDISDRLSKYYQILISATELPQSDMQIQVRNIENMLKLKYPNAIVLPFPKANYESVKEILIKLANEYKLELKYENVFRKASYDFSVETSYYLFFTIITIQVYK